MRELEKEMPLSWHIKMIPYKIWSKWYIFFHLSLPNFKYKLIEKFCIHRFVNIDKSYNDNYDLICLKCGKVK